MKKKMMIPLVVLAALAIGGTLIYRSRNGAPADRILLSGNIEMTEVDIAFKTAGKLIERTVDEGDRVKRGMTIARLDREQLEKQLEREQAALAVAQAQLAQSETAVRWQREQLGADLAGRRAELSAQQSRLAELRNGSRPEEVQEARAAVLAAEAEAQRAAKDWERAQVLFKNDDITAQQHDQYRTRAETAQAALRQARERLKLVEAGPRSEVIEAATAQVARARAGVQASEANELELKRREQEVTARRAEIERAKAQIALIETQLADTVAVSPADGVVLSKSAEVGEVLAPGTTVVTVGDMEHPWLRGYINERDLGRVKIGSKARVTTDAIGGRNYDGRVTYISPEAEFTPKQIQTQDERVKLVYRVKIEVANPAGELKSNMPVDAEIVVAE
jgi:HlyD family secretion protein